jgi:MtfA peptidase
MPPPDTVIVLPNGEEMSLSDSFFESSGRAIIEIPSKINRLGNDGEPQEHWGAFLIWVILFLVFVWGKEWMRKVPEKIKTKKMEAKLDLVGKDAATVYDGWLKKYNPYYAGLPQEQQAVFLKRVIIFRESKEFRFHSMVEEEYIPVLISGAAVQLAFGLKNYLMDFFHIIHVMRKEYVLNIDKETYYGHVSKNGIHISWNHFMEGYKDYGDSVNLGLHEMAHALQFDAYLGYENEHDRNFKDRLNDFSDEGRPVFRAMRAGHSLLFDEYAMTNFDEFWAVSVENFFENPSLFKERLPKLYQEISELLNQDPLLPYKVINPDLL